MGFWTNKEHRTGFDDAEDLAYAPSGGRIKMWLLGVGLALIPFGYGVHCLSTRHVIILGQNSSIGPPNSLLWLGRAGGGVLASQTPAQTRTLFRAKLSPHNSAQRPEAAQTRTGFFTHDYSRNPIIY